MVDKQVHDSFGDLVSDGFADDVEVRRDEGADEFCFQSFPLGEFRITLGRLRLLVSFKISHLTDVLHWGGPRDIQIENHNRYSPDLTLQSRIHLDRALVVWTILDLHAWPHLFGCSD